MDEYDIYIRSFATGRAEPAEVGLHRVFGIDARRARELMRSLPRVVKRHVPAEHLARYEQALRALGAEYELRRSAIRPVQTIAVFGNELDGQARQREEHGSTLTLPLPSTEPAPMPPSPHATIVDSRPPAHVASVVAQTPARGAPIAPAAAPERARAQPKWGEPQQVAKSPWTPIEPITAPEQRGEPPQAWEVPGLHIDGRPDWLEDGPRAYHHDAEAHELAGGARHPREPAAPAVDEHALASVRPSKSPMQLRGLHASSAARVGTVAGREVAGDEPTWLRQLLRRVGIGVALLAGLAAVRHFHVVDQVQKTLARWTHSSTSTGTAEGADDAPSASSYGPVAAQWSESDLHQFTNGDKDRVRQLVRRFEDAGAVGVYVGHIMQSGVVQVGGELVVQLPGAADKRSAVLAEYKRFLQGTFGDFVAAPTDPGGEVLRVAL